jgi:hypothetical protein
MPKQVYICEICLTPYTEEEAAANCESLHCPRDKVKIASLAWEHAEWVPAEIVLEVPIPNHPEDGTQKALFVRKDL